MSGASAEDLAAARATNPNLSIVVVPPVGEPLSVEDAKLRAGLSWPAGDPRDTQMDGFIKAARERIERETGWAFLTQTRDVYLSHVVLPMEWPGPIRPLQSVTQMVPAPATGYATDPEPPLALDGYPWVYRVVVGFDTAADIPPVLLFALGLLTSHYATVARDLVLVGTIATTVPFGYEDAIADYRLLAV